MDYLPWNREFGSALSKPLNFEGCEPPKPPFGTPLHGDDDYDDN
jgi:hypothetical protein